MPLRINSVEGEYALRVASYKDTKPEIDNIFGFDIVDLETTYKSIKAELSEARYFGLKQS